MQRRTLDKPYRRALANYPRHKEEIEQLPRKYDAVLARYPYKRGKYLLEEEDFFQELPILLVNKMIASKAHINLFVFIKSSFTNQNQSHHLPRNSFRLAPYL